MSRVTAGNLGRGRTGDAPWRRTGRQRTVRAVELRVHTVVLSHQGMDLAEYAHLTAVHQDPAQRPGVVGGLSRTAAHRRRRRRGWSPEWTGPRLSGQRSPFRRHSPHREHLGLVRHAVLPLKIGAAQFVQAGGLVAEVIVPARISSMEGRTVVRIWCPRPGFMIFLEFLRRSSLAQRILS